MQKDNFFISVIIPVFNEEESLLHLYRQLKEVLENNYSSTELIFVDDCSTDKSYAILEGFAAKDPSVTVISFRRNYGQTAAISAGIHHAQGEIIITIDADLQNDPADIPKLIEKLSEGYDVVSGWRKRRKDKLIFKKIPSWCANLLISKLSKQRIHDHGCTLKAYRASFLKNIRLYGEQHRFIPAMIAREGGKITELVVNHRARKYGYSKYGLERVVKVLLDVFFLKFISGYATRPLHFFGSLGILSILGGIGFGFYSAYLRYIEGFLGINLLPLLFACILLLLLGAQVILLGLLAEITIRIYYEAQKITTYSIRKIIKGKSRL